MFRFGHMEMTTGNAPGSSLAQLMFAIFLAVSILLAVILFKTVWPAIPVFGISILSMLVGAAGAAFTGRSVARARTRARAKISRDRRDNREAEKLKKIDAMHRANSRVPKVTR